MCSQQFAINYWKCSASRMALTVSTVISIRRMRFPQSKGDKHLRHSEVSHNQFLVIHKCKLKLFACQMVALPVKPILPQPQGWLKTCIKFCLILQKWSKIYCRLKKAVTCNHNLDKLQRKRVLQLRHLILEFMRSQDRILSMAEHKLHHFGGNAKLCSTSIDSCQSTSRCNRDKHDMSYTGTTASDRKKHKIYMNKP